MRSQAAVAAIFALCLEILAPRASIPAPSTQMLLPSISAPRTQPGQSATLLPDGTWLLLGGMQNGHVSAAASLYDPATKTTTALSANLAVARASHTATVLADGRVWVFGGLDAAGKVLGDAEVYDPATQSFAELASVGLVPRAHQVSNLLTDGTVLVAGGESLVSAQLWDPTSNTVSSPPNGMIVPRSNARSALLGSGPVLIAGGDANGTPVDRDELYEPTLGIFTIPGEGDASLPTPLELLSPVQVAQSLPAEAATGASISTRIAVRFTQPLDVRTLTPSTVTLFGPAGLVGAKLVAAEGGMLLFVSPKQQLLPGSYYTLFIRGATDARARKLPPFNLGFSTETISAPALASPLSVASSANGSISLGLWQPPQPGEPWITKTPPAPNPAAKLAPQKAPPGVTALTGQVLLQNGAPLPGVNVSVGAQTTMTDGTGRFLLSGLQPGHVQLIVNGRTVNTSSAQYGQFVIGADAVAGTTTMLGFTIWMPVIDTAHAVNISSPTTQEVRVTSPALPGVVLKIPAGAVIREPNGQIATSVSLTPVPLDRSPFPIPQFSMYFVIQPGGAVIESLSGSRLGAQLIYPNPSKRPAGSTSRFVYYDPSGPGWTDYGRGRISGRLDRIIPDDDTRLYGFSGFGDAEAENPPPPIATTANGCTNHGTDGEPVDCHTGLFLYNHVDMAISDTIPIIIRRSYQSSDVTPRNFGVGFSFDYSMWLHSAAGAFDTNFTTLNLILADGSQIPFTRTAQSAPTGLVGLQMLAGGTPSNYNGATITYDGTAYLIMTTKDGTQYKFNAADGRYLRAIINRNGQTLQVTAAVAQTGENYPIVTLTSPNGRWVRIQYVGAVGSYPTGTSQIASITDNSGRTVSYSYDTSGRLTKVTYPDGGQEQFTYDGTSDRIASVILPNGQTKVSNLFDSNQRVSQQTLADGGIYKFAYVTNGNGQVTQTTVTDPNGNVRIAQFNTAGYVTSDTSASGTSIQQVTTYQRDPTSNLVTSQTDALGRTTAYTYDTVGNTKSVTYLSGTVNAVTYAYTYTPTFNELASITDPLNHMTSFGYDGVGDLTSIKDPLNHVVATIAVNTATGLPTQLTDALNHNTQFAYQGSDLVTITDALGRASSRSVDALGRVVTVRDPLGEQSVYARDSVGRISQVTDPNGNVTALTYDLDGNAKSVTDARGGLTQFTYDGKDRLKTRIDPLTHSESFNYDHDDNQVSRTDRNGQQQILTFDALNRLSQIQYKTSTGTLESTVGYTYDAGNRATQIADSTSGTITRSYDGMDRLTNENTSNGSAAYQYDAASRRTQLIASGQSAPVTYGYDAADRLLNVTQGSSQAAIAYDNASRRTTLTLPNGIQLSYVFDNANELTGLTYMMGGTTVGTLTYGYDTAGHLTNRGGTLDATNLPTAVSSPTYNAANQLTNWAGSTLSYDNNGNLISSGSTHYTWNTRNQLVSISGPTTASFVYDAIGRRQNRTVAGAATGFLYDGPNLVQELAGTTPSANYLTGPRIDETYSRTDTTATLGLLTDALGSTLALTTSAGAVATNYTYDPYGSTSTSGATSANSLQYTGRENDGATGLYYYRARYYSPQMGRFISEDPIGLGGGPNLYAYVGGNPISRTDPLGLWSFSFAAYGGFGGTFIIGQDPTTGAWFYGGRLGIGLEIGGSLDTEGKRPGAETLCDTGPGTTFGTFGSYGISVGPLQYPLEEFAGGIDTSGKTYSEGPKVGDHITFGRGGGFDIGGSFGIEVIGHN